MKLLKGAFNNFLISLVEIFRCEINLGMLVPVCLSTVMYTHSHVTCQWLGSFPYTRVLLIVNKDML